jgi:hypothetical protein
MKYLYKYPQEPFPHDDLVATNRARDRRDLEYELREGLLRHEPPFHIRSAPPSTSKAQLWRA